MRVLVLADTHLKGGAEALPEAVQRELERADAVLHAGDVTSRAALTGLSDKAPFHAVLGNNDHQLVGVLPERLVVELAGVTVALVHDSGARTGRAGRLNRMFPDADLVVFGHSHSPVNELGIAGQVLFNPGSPTQRRMAPTHTVGVLELVDGAVRSRSIMTV